MDGAAQGVPVVGRHAVPGHRQPKGRRGRRCLGGNEAQQHPTLQVELNAEGPGLVERRCGGRGREQKPALLTRLPAKLARGLGFATVGPKLAAQPPRTADGGAEREADAQTEAHGIVSAAVSEDPCDQTGDKAEPQQAQGAAPKKIGTDFEREAGAVGGEPCQIQRRQNQIRRNTNVPLVPPKPKLFFTATSIFISRAVLAQ